MKKSELRHIIREEISKVLKENTNLLNIPEDEEDYYEDKIGEDIDKNGPYFWVRPVGSTIKVHFDNIINNQVTIEYEHNQKTSGYGANVTVTKDTEVIKINPSLSDKFQQALENGDYDTMIKVGKKIIDNL